MVHNFHTFFCNLLLLVPGVQLVDNVQTLCHIRASMRIQKSISTCLSATISPAPFEFIYMIQYLAVYICWLLVACFFGLCCSHVLANAIYQASCSNYSNQISPLVANENIFYRHKETPETYVTVCNQFCACCTLVPYMREPAFERWRHILCLKLMSIHHRTTRYITQFFSRSISQIAKFMGPTWGPSGPCRPQMGPMLGSWTLLSGIAWKIGIQATISYYRLCMSFIHTCVTTSLSCIWIMPD